MIIAFHGWPLLMMLWVQLCSLTATELDNRVGWSLQDLMLVIVYQKGKTDDLFEAVVKMQTSHLD